jgi:hypothetical protein
VNEIEVFAVTDDNDFSMEEDYSAETAIAFGHEDLTRQGWLSSRNQLPFVLFCLFC